MIYSIQNASLLKRASAWLLDIILFTTILTGCLWGWSFVFDPTVPMNELSELMEDYEKQYGGSLSLTEEELNKMTPEEQAEAQKIANQINEALSADEKAVKLLEMSATYLFALISLSVLCAHLLLEFAIPLVLKNGQTLGKKCFGIALVRKDGVKVTPFMMFVRTVLGKSTIETMLPVMLFVLAILGAGGLTTFLAIALLLAQFILPLWTANKVGIHDLLACTVAVDMSTQMIFDSSEELEAYRVSYEEALQNIENETSDGE